ncbi:TMEM43 family protein [Arvimicrobium flavum]|uniref:TMEM43 family protein n=1 Tax=Arvimicrobium flavum TaxID=3393320 RepID=UPI00237ACE35|nr:TMEM43 family protein [Mesorhizobium shangrilense]
MGDTFTVTTRTSWFARLKDSVIGVLVGLLLLAGMVFLLFWNEGRAVQTARSLAEGAGVVVSVTADSVDAANDDRLVHVSGSVTTDHTPADPTFAIAAEGLRLERRVEMYQWQEKSQSKTEDKLGGSQETVTTYSYSKGWDDSPVDSSDFQKPSGHENPPMEIIGQDFQVPAARLGAFELDQGIIAMIGGDKPLAIAPDRSAAIDAAFAGDKRVSVLENRIYLGSDPASPAVGDYRISYRLVPAGPASLIGRQQGDGFGTYQTEAGDELLMVEAGTASPAQMFADAQSANNLITWVIRTAGLIFLWVGFAMIMGPLGVVAAVIPPLGKLIDFGAGLVALLLAILVGTVTIGMAWFWYRPLLGAAIMAGGLAVAYGLGRLRRARGNAPAAAPAA